MQILAVIVVMKFSGKKSKIMENYIYTKTVFTVANRCGPGIFSFELRP